MNAEIDTLKSPRENWLSRSPTWLLFLLVFAGGTAVLAAGFFAAVVLVGSIAGESEDSTSASDSLMTTATVESQSRVAIECGEYQGVACQGYFTDEAGVVGDPQRVEDAIANLVGEYGNPIAIVVVENSRGETPADFAADLANAWGVGDPIEEDGILVLVSLDERRTEVVTQTGVEVSGDTIAAAARSFFQNEDWDGGMLAIIAAVEQELPRS